MHIEIDAIDRAIVNLLIQDGRMSSAEIARRIGNIPERSVRYRINRLLKDGVIRVRALVNSTAVGLPVMADVFIEVEAGRTMQVARKMAEFECVYYVACPTGERDVSLQVFARDNQELYKFVTEVIAQVPGVRKTSTVLLPVILKDGSEWTIPTSVCAKE